MSGQIREDQWDTELPPLVDMPGADQPVPRRQAINHYAYDNAWVPDMLAGRTMDEVGRGRFDGDLLGSDPRGNLEGISAAACDAARHATDRDAIVHCSYGDNVGLLLAAQRRPDDRRPRCGAAHRR